MNQTRIHRILAEQGAVAFPGVYDTLSARICQRVGFPMTFISGYSVAATSIGEPDLGLLTQTEMIDRARRISMSIQIPVIVDADTGYGTTLGAEDRLMAFDQLNDVIGVDEKIALAERFGAG